MTPETQLSFMIHAPITALLVQKGLVQNPIMQHAPEPATVEPADVPIFKLVGLPLPKIREGTLEALFRKIEQSVVDEIDRVAHVVPKYTSLTAFLMDNKFYGPYHRLPNRTVIQLTPNVIKIAICQEPELVDGMYEAVMVPNLCTDYYGNYGVAKHGPHHRGGDGNSDITG